MALAAILLLYMALPGQAATPSGAGTAGASFLKIPAGAEAAAMGTAWTAVASGARALQDNPGGLSRMDGRGEVAFSHSKLLGELTHQSAAAAFEVASLGGVVGVGLTRLGTDQKGYDESDRPTGGFSTNDLAFSVGYGTAFEILPERAFEDGRMLRLGGSLELIRQEVPGASGTGIAADVGAQGVLLESPRGALSLGLAALNLGPALKLGGKVSPLPRQFRLGAAYALREAKAALSLDLIHSIDEGLGPALGASWSPGGMFKLFVGWRPDRAMGSALDGATFGGGVMLRGVSVLGALSRTKFLGDSLRLELALRWGQSGVPARM